MNNKRFLVPAVIMLTGLTGCTIVVGPAYEPAPQPAPVVVQEAQVPQLQQLVAPIALYPDPLLADILPASTYPQQIQDASQWASYNPGAPQGFIDAQPWAPSVKALVHYPSLLAYMNSDIGWTQSLGSAFIAEQPYVMAAIQDLRQQAYSVGNLYSTPQQMVVLDGGYIYIQPANPSFVYVPTYDPVVVYSSRTTIAYGAACVTGIWFTHAFDWDRHSVYVVNDWRAGWNYDHNGWHRDAGYRWDQNHSWARDDQRGGPPPHVPSEKYAVRQDMRGRNFQPVRATHIEAVRHEPAKQSDRNNNAPAGKENQKPPEKSVNPPSPRPGPNPGNKPQEKPGDKPADKPGNKPADKPGDKPGNKPGENSGDKSADKPGAKPGDKPAAKPEPKPKPDQKPGDKPAPKPAPPKNDNN